jgi:minimal PKS acyl carrier protein
MALYLMPSVAGEHMDKFNVSELKKIVDTCEGGNTAIELTEANLDVALDDLGYDSLTVYEFVTKIQDDLAMVITDEEIDTMTTPRAVIDFVNGRLAEKQSCTS